MERGRVWKCGDQQTEGWSLRAGYPRGKSTTNSCWAIRKGLDLSITPKDLSFMGDLLEEKV